MPPGPVRQFWTPNLDPARPYGCTQPEAYVLRHIPGGGYLAVACDDGSVIEVEQASDGHQFHAHEAAIRVAKELNDTGRGPVDVVKVERSDP